MAQQFTNQTRASSRGNGKAESKLVPNGNACYQLAFHAPVNSHKHDCQFRFRFVPPGNGRYREANCLYYSENEKRILLGAYHYTSQKRHQKFCELSLSLRRFRQKFAGQHNPQFQ